MSSDFKFACHSELECFNSCCKKVDLFLTPYDVLRMRKNLGISSGDFLKNHTSIVMGEVGLPLLFVNMKEDEESSCPFLGEEGCDIYEDRPGLCRLYPLEPSGENIKIVKRPECLGFNESKNWTLKNWNKKQGINQYEELDTLFKEITLDEKLLSGFNLNNTNVISMFFMVFDLDNFKKFVFDTKFLDVFEVDKEEVERAKEDEVELLKFALKWLKFGLLDHKTFMTKESYMKAATDKLEEENEDKFF